MTKLDLEYLRKNLQSLYKRIVVVDETSSTNDLIKNGAYYNDRILLFARSQTAGRGTNNRTFYTEKDKGVYVSCLIDLETIQHKSSFIPIVMACSIAQTLDFYGFEPRLKWVNDVLVGNNKVAGILCEKTSSDSLLIVGIGLNVYPILFPNDIRLIATSLQEHTKIALNINEIAVYLFKRFHDLLNQDSKSVVTLFRTYYKDLHKKIVIKYNNEFIEGVIVDIDELGTLIVEVDNKKISVYSTEQIFMIEE